MCIGPLRCAWNCLVSITIRFRYACFISAALNFGIFCYESLGSRNCSWNHNRSRWPTRNINNESRCSSSGSLLLLRSIESSLCAPFVMLCTISITWTHPNSYTYSCFKYTRHHRSMASNMKDDCSVFKLTEFMFSTSTFWAFFFACFAPTCAQYFHYLFAFGRSNQNSIEKQIEAKYTNQKSIKCLSVRPIGHSPFNWNTVPFIFCYRLNYLFFTRFCIYNLTVNIFILLTTIGGPVHTRALVHLPFSVRFGRCVLTLSTKLSVFQLFVFTIQFICR